MMNVKLVLLIVAMILVVPSISTAENNKEYTIEMDLIISLFMSALFLLSICINLWI